MLHKLSKSVLRLFGWKLVGKRPDTNKYMALCAPHTSNFDALWFFVTMMALGIKPKVMIKASYNRFPIRRPFKWIGGIPVERGFKAKDVAQQLVEYVDSADDVALMLAPEGSRSYQKFWKHGFYQIAQATKLPVYFGFIDYSKGELGFHDVALYISGDPAVDMQVIRDFYGGKSGKYPELAGPIRLKRE